MQLKVGSKIYKDSEQPVGIFLTAQDRLNILAMDPKRNFYCAFPKDTTEEAVKAFMTMPAPAPAPAPLAPAPVPVD